MQFERFVKLQKYYLNEPVDPAIYKQGNSLGFFDNYSVEECENGGGSEPGEITYYHWNMTDNYICEGTSKVPLYYKQYGVTPDGPWTNVEPAEYMTGVPIAKSNVCGGQSHNTDDDYLTLGDSILPTATESTGSINFGESAKHYFDYDYNTGYIIGTIPSNSTTSSRWWAWGFGPDEDVKIGGGWRPSLTYNHQYTYSVVDNMAFHVNADSSWIIYRPLKTSNFTTIEKATLKSMVSNYLTSQGISYGYFPDSFFDILTFVDRNHLVVSGTLYNREGSSTVSWPTHYFMARINVVEDVIDNFHIEVYPHQYSGNHLVCVETVNPMSGHIIWNVMYSRYYDGEIVNDRNLQVFDISNFNYITNKNDTTATNVEYFYKNTKIICHNTDIIRLLSGGLGNYNTLTYVCDNSKQALFTYLTGTTMDSTFNVYSWGMDGEAVLYKYTAPPSNN